MNSLRDRMKDAIVDTVGNYEKAADIANAVFDVFGIDPKYQDMVMEDMRSRDIRGEEWALIVLLLSKPE